MIEREGRSGAARSGLPKLVAAVVITAVVTFGVAALLVTMIERKTEAKNRYLKFVEVTNETTDPAIWGSNWPTQYDQYQRTVDVTHTRYGGSEAMPEQRLDRDPWLKREIAALLKVLEAHLKAVETGIAALIDTRDRLATEARRLRSVPGIGPALAAVILARLPELGSLDHRRIASLAGLAPQACDSGIHRGKRRIWGGRADVRRALYLAGFIASRHDPTLKTFRQRLEAFLTLDREQNRGGAKGKLYRKHAIAVLADAFPSLFGGKPTSSPGGDFCTLCEHVLPELGEDTEGLETAIQRVLKHIRT